MMKYVFAAVCLATVAGSAHAQNYNNQAVENWRWQQEERQRQIEQMREQQMWNEQLREERQRDIANHRLW